MADKKKSSGSSGTGGSGKKAQLPAELAALQEAEAAERLKNPQPKVKKQPGSTGKEVSLDEIQKFVRGDITLAQLEGLTRDQLYDFAELGYTMFKSGKFDDACKVFEGLVTYNPYDAYFHSALGAIYQKQKRYDDAIRQYDLAVKFNPEDCCSYTNRGETYLLLGRLKEAAADFQRSIQLDPQEKDAWAMRARALVIAVTQALEKGGAGNQTKRG